MIEHKVSVMKNCWQKNEIILLITYEYSWCGEWHSCCMEKICHKSCKRTTSPCVSHVHGSPSLPFFIARLTPLMWQLLLAMFKVKGQLRKRNAVMFEKQFITNISEIISSISMHSFYMSFQRTLTAKSFLTFYSLMWLFWIRIFMNHLMVSF